MQHASTRKNEKKKNNTPKTNLKNHEQVVKIIRFEEKKEGEKALLLLGVRGSPPLTKEDLQACYRLREVVLPILYLLPPLDLVVPSLSLSSF